MDRTPILIGVSSESLSLSLNSVGRFRHHTDACGSNFRWSLDGSVRLRTIHVKRRARWQFLFPATSLFSFSTESIGLACDGNASLKLACQGRGRVQRQLWTPVENRPRSEGLTFVNTARNVTGECLAQCVHAPKAALVTSEHRGVVTRAESR